MDTTTEYRNKSSESATDRNKTKTEENLHATSEEVKHSLDDATATLREEADSKTESLRDEATDEMDNIAEAVDSAGNTLREEHHETLSEYVGDIAQYVSGMADNLRHKTVDELIHDAKHIARENPGIFIAGGVAVGLGIARLARSSSKPQQTDTATDQYRQPYDSQLGGQPQSQSDQTNNPTARATGSIAGSTTRESEHHL